MTLTVASLSSGYGGLEMALRLWLPGLSAVRWHAEVDPDASRVLKTWWPEVPNLGDFTRPGFWEEAERADCHVGGIPCQPFSPAGRQLGEDDPRHLWPYWRRGIELHRPATVVFENVQGLTGGKMRPIFDAIIADLVALGYDVRWCLLGACAVGAAHHRHRVFLLACRTRTTPHARQVGVQTCGQRDAAYLPTPHAQDGAAGSVGGEGLRDVARLELLPTPSASSYGSNQGGGAGRVGPVRHSLDSMVRLDLLRTPSARDGDMRGQGSEEHMRRRVEKGDHLNLGDQVALLPPAVQPGRWGRYAVAVARHEAVLGRPAPEPMEIGPKGGRCLAAAFSEWLMMLPEGHLTSVLDRNPALARAGNGVVPLQAATALRLLFDDLTSGA